MYINIYMNGIENLWIEIQSIWIEKDILSKRIYQKCVFNDDYPICIYIYVRIFIFIYIYKCIFIHIFVNGYVNVIRDEI